MNMKEACTAGERFPAHPPGTDHGSGRPAPRYGHRTNPCVGQLPGEMSDPGLPSEENHVITRLAEGAAFAIVDARVGGVVNRTDIRTTSLR